MKKSNYFALVMGTVSGVMFALGMCMALVEEWAMLKGGVILGGAGLLLGLVTLLIWRRMTHKEPVRVSGKLVAQILLWGAGRAGTGHRPEPVPGDGELHSGYGHWPCGHPDAAGIHPAGEGAEVRWATVRVQRWAAGCRMIAVSVSYLVQDARW